MYEKGDLVFHIHHLKDFGPGIVLGIKGYKYYPAIAYIVYFSTNRVIVNAPEEDLVRNAPEQTTI